MFDREKFQPVRIFTEFTLFDLEKSLFRLYFPSLGHSFVSLDFSAQLHLFLFFRRIFAFFESLFKLSYEVEILKIDSCDLFHFHNYTEVKFETGSNKVQ